MALQNGKRGSDLTLTVIEQYPIVQIGFPAPGQYALELLPAAAQPWVVGPADEFFPGGWLASATQGCRKRHALAGKVFELLRLFELAADNGFESACIRRQCQGFRGEARGQHRRRFQLAIEEVQQWLHLG